MHDVSKKARDFLGSVERRAQMYKTEYNKATNKLTVLLVDKTLGVTAAISMVKLENIKHMGYPKGFAKPWYFGKLGAAKEFWRVKNYPLTIVERTMPALVGEISFWIGKEATFYFKAYRDVITNDY